jgi:small subunit ribosomal protein S4
MAESKCKICRRVGEKLFLKGDRCFTQKCAVTRKPYPPGIHTRPSRRGLSEYGTQLREKQKLRNLFHLREKQFSNYVYNAMATKGADVGETLLVSLSSRLDNIIFVAGFAQSRSVARHIVSHGHAQVNGRRTNVPSHHIATGDIVTISDNLWKTESMQTMAQLLKKHTPPAWITLDAEKKTAAVTQIPDAKNIAPFNTKLIVEYYAR